MENDKILGKWFVGDVVINDDPLKLSRIKVKIPVLFDEYKNDDLPWVALVRPIFRGNANNAGMFSIPKIGSRVLIQFDKGDIKSGFAFGEIADGVSKPTNLHVSYPDSYGWVDEKLNEFIIDTRTDITTIKHSSGTKIVIAANGALTVTTVADATLNTTGNILATATGNITATADGNLAVTVGGTANVTSTGKATVKSANIELDGGGGQIDKVVTTKCLCSLTGLVHIDGSTTVKASK
jgi:hypothetical protein